MTDNNNVIDAEEELNLTNRTVARKAFGEEINAVRGSVEVPGDGEYDRKFHLLPSGAAAGRVHIVGALTRVDELDNDANTIIAEVNTDQHSGKVTLLVGQRADGVRSQITNADVPSWVSVVGNLNVRNPEEDDVDEFDVSLDVESFAEVDQQRYKSWVARTAEQTLDRIERREAGAQLILEKDGEEMDLMVGAEAGDLAMPDFRDSIAKLLEDEFDVGGPDPEASGAAEAAAD
ncbi:hypothetical protein RYH80_17845 [Halobaculum sp. MBLA0147]|uniref:hypothetical protein n=1 Tax=Halobaculum sp. MBLA0147 TaxID=3079934 RepID=UPI0035265F90